MVPKGVIWGGALDGSNQVGAIVTCQATMTSPLGAAWPAASWIVPNVRTAAASNKAIRRWEDRMFTLRSRDCFQPARNAAEDGLKERLPSRTIPLTSHHARGRFAALEAAVFLSSNVSDREENLDAHHQLSQDHSPRRDST